MTFSDWRRIDPSIAARFVHERAQLRLSPAQHRAVLASLTPPSELERQLASAPAHAPLKGVPCLVKDLFDIAGLPTFAGSTFLPELRGLAANDSALVRRLREAGAALAGKTHMHEFAYGISGENPHYGDVDRPGFPGRTTGGSSSGSAAAVAAGIVPLALGSDTGGSVRLPAAFCGLFGLRLTPGDAFVRDAFPLSPTCDTAGWFTASAADMRAATAALIGLSAPATSPRGCSLALSGLDDDVARAFAEAAARFAPAADSATADALRAGFAGAADVYNTIVAREAWAVHEGWAARFRERYDPAVWQRLNRVHNLTAAQHRTADAGLAAIRALFADYFRTFDFLVLPASPAGAFRKDECTLENRGRILALTAPASLGGCPVLTIPIGLPSGLTTGLQIVVRDPQSAVIPWALALCGAAG